jgi:hypothetical protein
MVKPVHLGDKCSFDCSFNPVTGDFVITIRGSVENLRDYKFPSDSNEVAVFASGLTMVSLIAQDSFSHVRNFVSKHPEKCFY